MGQNLRPCSRPPDHRVCTDSFKSLGHGARLHSYPSYELFFSPDSSFTLPCMTKILKKDIKKHLKQSLSSLLLWLTLAFFDDIYVMTDISLQPSVCITMLN